MNDQNTLLLGGVLPASRLGYGCMRLAGHTLQEAENMVGLALDQGITLFDHADIYGAGQSETLFGEVLKAHPSWRERLLVQGKCGIAKQMYDASREHILEAVERSLKRLQTEYLDLLLLHRPDALMEPEEVAEAFETLHRDGKVRYFGVSNQNSMQMELLQSCMSQKLLVNQLQFGPAHTGLIDVGVNVNITSDHAVDRNGSILDYCRLHHVTIQAWSPFMYGMFEGVYTHAERYAELNQAIHAIAQSYAVPDSAIAIAWITRHPAGIQTLLGTMNPEHLKDSCASLRVKLTREEWYRIYRAAGNPIP